MSYYTSFRGLDTTEPWSPVKKRHKSLPRKDLRRFASDEGQPPNGGEASFFTSVLPTISHFSSSEKRRKITLFKHNCARFLACAGGGDVAVDGDCLFFRQSVPIF